MFKAFAVSLSAACLATTFCTAPAWGADTNERFAVEGGGAQACSLFLEAERDRKEQYTYYIGWVQGYLTALNRFQDDTFDMVPWQNTQFLTLALISFCKDNQDTPLFRATDYLSLVMSEQRLRSESKSLVLGQSDSSIIIYQEILRRAQAKLIQGGFLEGTADGTFGPKTRLALEAFQKSKEIEVTGLPDQVTLFHLFAEGLPTSGKN
ncbi:hypothetical protein JCM17844_26650 [Iodidimonas gelatinilytica]|uniref:Peptidoglycan binding-like domain-containing protein n=1 Tax=Iodidimonas gelatinilytica TaxID=1236966 RepID=A0A5A7MVG9_9PROT|nr:peptidoglycan-binding domain-containing protein [Iodidimonas gelatinilytica]GEQ99028.1 hypothetical protein JCM17844_26650 [Iodidimonas gelatinilytica]